jgi:carbonyl reductase 1
VQKVRDPSLRALLLDEDRLTEAAIEDMVLRFLSEVKDGASRGTGARAWTHYAVGV